MEFQSPEEPELLVAVAGQKSGYRLRTGMNGLVTAGSSHGKLLLELMAEGMRRDDKQKLECMKLDIVASVPVALWMVLKQVLVLDL